MSRMTNALTRNKLLLAGIVGVVVIALLLVLIVVIGTAGIGKRSYSADFAQAGGIRPGDNVRVAGIDVGEVTSTSLEGDHVRVEMMVDNDVEVTANGGAEIKMSTLLGQRYVDVWLGDAAEPLGDDHLSIDQTDVPYDLQATIDAGTPILADTNTEDFAESVVALNEQLEGAPAIARPTIDALTAMSEVITNRRDQINQLIEDTRSVTDIVNDSQYQLSIIVGQGAQLAGKIQAREELVTRLLDGIAELTEQARIVAAENQNQFAPVMVNLNTISEGLEKNRDNLRKLLEILPVTARLTNNIIGDGPYANGYLPWGVFPDNWLCLARVVDGC